MGGGLMQLVAYGAQDIYLTGNPQITFFKVVYRRHTNFSMETIEQTVSGTAIASAGGTGTVTISRNGDLVHKVYVTSSTAGIENGDELVSEVELEIGGQKIDRHYKEWNQIWNELSTPESQAVGLKSMKGCVGSSGTTGAGMVQVPLNFWFCRNPGLALPLIALQYHEVKLKFTWGTDALTGATDATCKVMCDYIYLDTDERRRFAQVSHEYLIEQLQKQSADTSGSVKLNFNHPVKELIWTSARTNAYGTAQLKLNGHDRFSSQEEEYFQLRQPYDYHTAVPKQNLPSAGKALQVDWHANSAPADFLLVSTRNGRLGSTFTTPGDFNQFTNATTPSTDGTAAGSCKFFSFLASDWTSATNGTGTPYVQIGDVHYIAFRDAATVANTGSRVCEFGRRAVVTSLTVENDVTEAAAGYAVGEVSVNNGGLLDSAFDETDLDDATLVIGYDIDVHNGMTGNDNSSLHIQRLSSRGARTSQMTKKINVYSFALKPEEHQPSGTCNFSRIDNAKLDTNVALTTDDNIYAVNYNVLRIMSGMGGLAYSN